MLAFQVWKSLFHLFSLFHLQYFSERWVKRGKASVHALADLTLECSEQQFLPLHPGYLLYPQLKLHGDNSCECGLRLWLEGCGTNRTIHLCDKQIQVLWRWFHSSRSHQICKQNPQHLEIVLAPTLEQMRNKTRFVFQRWFIEVYHHGVVHVVWLFYFLWVPPKVR